MSLQPPNNDRADAIAPSSIVTGRSSATAAPEIRRGPGDAHDAPASDHGAGWRSDHVIVGHWLANGGPLFVHAPGEPCRLCQRGR